jgi:hypothetical protein
MLQKINRIMDILLCAIRKWWRPITCVGIAGSVVVHGIILPLITKTGSDLPGLAGLIAAATAAFAVREWGKTKGSAE